MGSFSSKFSSSEQNPNHVNPFYYKGVATAERTCGIRHLHRQIKRKGCMVGGAFAHCARVEDSTRADPVLPRTPTRVGRIRPCLGFGRGVAATLETLPGHRPEGTEARLSGAHACRAELERDLRLPGEERDPGPSKFVAGWTGLWTCGETCPWKRRADPCVPGRAKGRRGEGRGARARGEGEGKAEGGGAVRVGGADSYLGAKGNAGR